MTDERANARAAALVILETLPAWGQLAADSKGDLLERYTDAILRQRKRAAVVRVGNNAIGPSDGNSGGL